MGGASVFGLVCRVKRESVMAFRLWWVVLLPVMLLLSGCGYWHNDAVVVPEKPQRPPNFILIVLDDLGTHDLGFTGNTFVETPSLDALAKQGVVFTQAYANAPNCAPSRAALMSGQYPPRTGVYTMMTGEVGKSSRRKLQAAPNRAYLPESVYTLAEALRDQGYVTANIGKWNLGTGLVRGPLGQGFDVNVGGYRGGADHYMAPYNEHLPGLQQAPAGEYLTDRLNTETVHFIESHAEKPFFLYLPHFAPHFPIEAPSETVAKYQAKLDALCAQDAARTDCHAASFYPAYAAMLEHVDRGVGDIRATLARLGLDDNTVIVVTSDNGGYAWSDELQVLRGGKSQLYEGGIRVPMAWYVPRAQHAGSSQSLPVTLLDVYPTFLTMAGVSSIGLRLDGRDLSPLLGTAAGGSVQPLRQRPLFWYMPGYTQDTEPTPEGMMMPADDKPFTQLPAAVIRQGDWKLIRYYGDTPTELYDLSNDPMERYNLFDVAQSQARELMGTLENWLRNSGGALELPKNPDYRGGQ